MVCEGNLQGSQPGDRASSLSPRYDAKGLGIQGLSLFLRPSPETLGLANVRQLSVVRAPSEALFGLPGGRQRNFHGGSQFPTVARRRPGLDAAITTGAAGTCTFSVCSPSSWTSIRVWTPCRTTDNQSVTALELANDRALPERSRPRRKRLCINGVRSIGASQARLS